MVAFFPLITFRILIMKKIVISQIYYEKMSGGLWADALGDRFWNMAI